ncbi:MAG: NACHT domain-containing protein, partial [Planctomycetota bacterium]|nr:NACHT domain-containing protein [Planctomycetota bacterium]
MPVKIENPGSALTRELATDAKKLLIEVGKAGFNIASGSYGKLIGNAKAIYDELARLTDGQLGWVLIHRSMSQAVAELYSELNFDYADLFEETVGKSLSATIDEQLEAASVVINKDFFRQPAPRFVAQIAESVKQRLEATGLTPVEAGAMANRLPSYFLHALQREFGAERTKYQKLVDQSETPFDGDAETRFQWQEYSTWLDRRLHEPLFEERFCLLDVFVDLRAWAVPEKVDNDARRSRGVRSGLEDRDEFGDADDGDAEDGGDNKKPEAFMLDDRLRHWLEELKNNYRTDNAVRVLTGGPGSGKSSSVRKFAAEISREEVGLNAVYVPLHLFDFQGKVDTALDSFCANHTPRLPGGLLSPSQNSSARQPSNERLLLIFDGLDELAKSGNVGAEAASDFVVAVHKLIEICGRNRQLAVLFCGRPIAVSKSTHRTIADQHVFHLLSYFPSENDQQRLHDPLKILAADQRDQRDKWWQLYGKARGTDEAGMPGELKNKGKDFEEITAEPLLNYLIALTYGRWKSNPEASSLDLSGEVNLNDIYHEMLNGVWERRYADADRTQSENGSERVHPAVGLLTRDEFGELLEDIALAAWHSAGRAASMEQVLAHLNSEQKTRLKVLSDDTSTGVLKLFLGFYIQSRQLGPGQELFEFTHKSFGEYLTARRLLVELQMIHDDWKVRQRSSRGNKNPLNQALVDWIKAFGPTAIDDDLLRFLHREFQRGDVAATGLEDWRQFLGTLMATVLNDGLPMKQVLVDASFHEMNRQAIHAEQALLILHDCAASALNRLAEKRIAPTRIAWPQ